VLRVQSYGDLSSFEASQGLFPVILGHEGGGVVSQNTC
jgi:Zn-dependent alcohol dehydrogenase